MKQGLMSDATSVRNIIESLRPGQVLTETEYFNVSRRFGNLFKAGSGAEAVRKILERMDLKKEIRDIERELETTKDVTAEVKLLRRLKTFRSMQKTVSRPEWMVMTNLPVLPPDLRPMVALDGGRYATSDLNDLYRRVINRNNRLKKLLEIKAPEVIVKNEKRMLQEAVDALIDNSARFGTQQMSSQRRPLRSHLSGTSTGGDPFGAFFSAKSRYSFAAWYFCGWFCSSHFMRPGILSALLPLGRSWWLFS